MNKLNEFLTKKTPFVSTASTDILLVLLSTITGILTARFLGPVGRGEFAIVILWPSIFAIIGCLGIREALTYKQAQNTYPAAQLVGIGVMFGLIQSIVLILIGVLIIPLVTRSLRQEITFWSMVYLPFIPMNLLTLYSLGLLQGKMDFLRFNIIRLSVNAIYLILLIFLWILDSITVRNLTLCLLGANLFTTILSLKTVIEKCGFQIRFDAMIIGELLSYGLRNHFGSISNFVNQRLDQVFMAILLKPEQLGWYTVAISTAGITRIATTALSALLFPKIAIAPDLEKRHLLIQYSRMSVASATLFALVLMLISRSFIPLFYGTGYSNSILPAEILIIAALFMGVGLTWSAAFRGLGYPGIPAKAELLALLITVIGLYFLLPILGVIGAALTSLGASFLSTLYLYAQLRNIWGYKTYELINPFHLMKIFSRPVL
jgi:O-antigen/teichoic acid export membrane protein